jgi:hypothetical protein
MSPICRRLIAVAEAHRPPEERLVERRAAAEIGHFERDVIEVQRVPAGALERRRRRQFRSGRAFASPRLGAIGDREIETVGILDAEAEIVAGVIGNRVQTALVEFRLHLVGVPRLDAPCEAVEHGMDGRTADAESSVGDRRRRRRRQPAADHNAAGVFADVQHRLLAVVAAHLPSHQRGIEGRRLPVVGALVRGDRARRSSSLSLRMGAQWRRIWRRRAAAAAGSCANDVTGAATTAAPRACAVAGA